MRGLIRLRREEEGATLAIVALALVALVGMVVLTVDVGGLVVRRRQMVNANDSAALAAAKAFAAEEGGAICGSFEAPAQTIADSLAVTNASGASSTLFTTDCVAQTVSVEYERAQQLFFAPVLGFGDSATVAATATAKWGQSTGGTPLPVELDPQRTNNCVFEDPDDPEGGFKPPGPCPDGYWFDPNETDAESAWGLLSLNEWAPDDGANDPQANCDAGGGSADLRGWIDQTDPLDVRLAEVPTYVCTRNGASATTWLDALEAHAGTDKIFLFPINDPNQMAVTEPWLPGQVDVNSTNKEKYAIVAFAPMKIVGVYRGNTVEAIGTPGVTSPGSCTNAPLGASGAGDPSNPGLLGGWDLVTFAQSNPACTGGTPDAIDPASVSVRPPRGPALTRCTSPGVPATCSYYFNPANNILSWWNAATKNAANRVSYSWTSNVSAGTTGGCGANGVGPTQPESRAYCLVLAWAGPQLIGQDPGPPGPGFGAQSITLVK